MSHIHNIYYTKTIEYTYRYNILLRKRQIVYCLKQLNMCIILNKVTQILFLFNKTFFFVSSGIDMTVDSNVIKIIV